MKNGLIKYTSLAVMVFFLLMPLRIRAKLLWFLFTVKNGIPWFAKKSM